MTHTASPTLPGLLEGKTALITGATSGIGKAMAFLFAQSGCKHVIAVGTSEEKGQKLLEEAKHEGLHEIIHFHKADVSKKSDIDQLFEAVFKYSPQLDILVNNAGITKDGLLLRMSEADWDNVMNINLKSCFYTCQVASRAMMKARSGSIINVTSVVGLIGNPGQTNYAASKAGMIGFSKSLAREIASRNVRVNCIAPGFVETGMTHALGDDKQKEVTQGIPFGRMGTCEEIAMTALFLASPMSSYMTGQVVTVDGGLSMA